MNRKYVLPTIGILLAIRLYFAYKRTLIPFEIDYEEGNILNAAVRILHGQTPYPTPGSFPYVLNPYGPVGYLVAALGVRIFGISLLGPRLLVLLSGIFIVFLIAAVVQHLGGRFEIGCLFGAVYLCSPTVWRWYPLLRVDFWAVALSLSGIYVFIAFPRFRFVSALLFALALLTKPSALAAPIVCCMELIIEKRTRDLQIYILLLMGAVGSCILLIGPNFRFALLETHPDPYSILRVLKFYSAALQGAVMPLIILLLALFSGLRWNSRSRIVWFYAAAVCVTSLTSGKLGSETNHFLEWTAALCLLSGLALSSLHENRSLTTKPLLAGTLALTGFFAVVPYKTLAASQDQSQCQEAYQFLEAFRGNSVLAEDVTALVLAGKPVLASNPFVITQLGNRVSWSRGSLDEMVGRKEFDLIILGGQVPNFDPASGRWSPKLIQNVSKDYVLQRSFLCAPGFGAAYAPRSEPQKAP
jgi:hypothetical protein